MLRGYETLALKMFALLFGALALAGDANTPHPLKTIYTASCTIPLLYGSVHLSRAQKAMSAAYYAALIAIFARER